MLPAGRGGLGKFGIAEVPLEKGLFPAGLGAAAFGKSLDVESGDIGAAGATCTSDAAIASFVSCAFANCSRVPSGSCARAASISSALGAALFLAVVFLAAAFFAGFGCAAAALAASNSGNFSINFRTTGASTVDDADRTNSPTSCNFARSSLLSKPISFANS